MLEWPPSNSGISIAVLGEGAFFSPQGKGTCFLIGVGSAQYLLDIGAPPFALLGPDALNGIRGILQTHVHDDHKRWFTDYVLYCRYMSGGRAGRVNLVTVDKIHDEMRKNNKAALERTLSPDGRQVIDIDYESMVAPLTIGPRPKFRLELLDLPNGMREWRVLDHDDNVTPPQKAKVVISDQVQSAIPRMLFFDDDEQLWVEPESYYAYSDTAFYESDRRDLVDEESGLRIRAHKSASWHGLPIVGYEFSTANDRVFVPSDTVFNLDLWRGLSSERRTPESELFNEEFLQATILRGNINDYIQRTWSRARFERALDVLSHGLIVQDVSHAGSVVHTNYADILAHQEVFGSLLLSHSPDNFVGLHPLAGWGKVYRRREGILEERCHDGWYPCRADVYLRRGAAYQAGFRDDNGAMAVVCREDGRLDCVPREQTGEGRLLFHANMFEDLNGTYVPAQAHGDAKYRVREDGRIERLPDEARAEFVTNQRPR